MCLFLYLTGLTDAGLMETSNLPYGKVNIERNRQRNTTQKVPESLDGQILETLENKAKENIGIMLWVITKSSYFTPWFEENNIKNKTPKRDNMRDEGAINTKILRNMMIRKNMRIRKHRRVQVYKRHETRAQKVNSYFSK